MGKGKGGCNVFRVDFRLIRNNLRSSLRLQASGRERNWKWDCAVTRKAFSLLNNLRWPTEIADVLFSLDFHGNSFENLHAMSHVRVICEDSYISYTKWKKKNNFLSILKRKQTFAKICVIFVFTCKANVIVTNIIAPINQKILSLSYHFSAKDLSILSFSNWHAIFHNHPPIHCHYHREIYAIYSRLDNQFVQRSEHASNVTFARQCVEFYRRAITDATCWSRANRATWALSIFVGNFTGRPFVSTSTRRGKMESPSSRRNISGCARANPYTMLHDKSYLHRVRRVTPWNVSARNTTGSGDASFFSPSSFFAVVI